MMNIRSDRLPDATTGGPKKIFAVLSRSVTVRGKTIRQVLIFDNHPATLRLLNEVISFDMLLEEGVASPQPALACYIVLGIVSIVLLAAGIFWPLL